MNERPENRWGKTLTDILGWSRPFCINNVSIDHEILISMQNAEILVQHENLDVNKGEIWQSLVRVSSLDDELFFHSAYPTTASDSIFFGPDTYRFVRAIKTLIKSRPSNIPVRRAIDIGCGAGPGAILMAKAYPQAEIFAGDINDAALRITQINACLARVELTACKSDILKNVDGDFDLIVSNPPYLVDPSKRRYRHGGGALGSALSLDILNESIERLAPEGTLLLYTGSPIVHGNDIFYNDVKTILQGKNLCWSYEEMDPDVFGEELLCEAYSQTDRIAAIVLIVTKCVKE